MGRAQCDFLTRNLPIFSFYYTLFLVMISRKPCRQTGPVPSAHLQCYKVGRLSSLFSQVWDRRIQGSKRWDSHRKERKATKVLGPLSEKERENLLIRGCDG